MVDGVYNYLIRNYTPKNNTKFDIHKSSELRRIYNSIVKISKESPLYIVKLSEDNQNFALTMKDNALALRAQLAAVNESNESSVFAARNAVSDDDSIACASIVTEDYSSLPEPFTLKINKLATPQVNDGITLFGNGKAPAEGAYRFSLQTGGASFEYQFQIGQDTKNEEVLTKLSDFINKSQVGIHSSIVRNTGDNTMLLRLRSLATGYHLMPIFQLNDISSPKDKPGIVEFYDLNRIAQRPANAQIEINGEAKESESNQFIINSSVRLDLVKPAKDPVQINYIPDCGKIVQGIHKLADSYNALISLANTNMEKQRFAGKLRHELSSTVKSYKNELESSGITFDNEGYMEIDDFLADEAAADGDLKALFGSWTGLAGNLAGKLSMISIDPIEYIDKTLVTYPNTSKPGTANPYMTSVYSGLLYNSYC